MESVTVFRHIDKNALLSPKIMTRENELNSDCSNLVNVLFTISGGRVSEEISEILRIAFNSEDVTVYFEPSPDGRIISVFYVDGLELRPISVPDGVWKCLAIELAILTKSSLIAIDEFENSLHVKLQEFLIQELRRSGITTIIATHSPIVIDSVQPNEITILERKYHETITYKFKNKEEVEKKLKERGLALSDALRYGIVTKDELQEIKRKYSLQLRMFMELNLLRKF